MHAIFTFSQGFVLACWYVYTYLCAVWLMHLYYY